MNSDTAEEVVGQLVTLEREQERLNYYVSLLNPRHAELLKLLYFEGYSQEECAKNWKSPPVLCGELRMTLLRN